MIVRIAMLALLLLASGACAETLDDFRLRIEAATGLATVEGRSDAIESLYYMAGVDEQMRGRMDQAVKMLADHPSPGVSFAPLDPGFSMVNVLNGYEYRPNLEPLGLVELSGNNPGGDTRLPYAKQGDRYFLPATVRKLVNADAKPDVMLQIITIGMASPPVTFSGWCDVLLSDGSIQRREISDNGSGNNTLAFRAQSFESCEVVNTAGRGMMTLKLKVDADTIFKGRASYPEDTIRFPETAGNNP